MGYTLIDTSVKRERRLRFLATQSLYWTLASYIKPGALHRFSASLERFDNLMLFVFAYGAVIDDILSFGELLGRGKRGLGDFPLGSILSNIRSFLLSYAPGAEERLVPPLILASTADLLHYITKNELSGEQLYIYSSISGDNVKEFFDFLKTFDREAKVILNRRGYNESNVADASLLEIINAIASQRRRDYEFLIRQSVGECASEVEKRYLAGETLNNSIVSGFITLLLGDDKIDAQTKSRLQEALKLGGMKTREGGKALLDVDKQLASRGTDTNDNLIPLLKCTNRFLFK